MRRLTRGNLYKSFTSKPYKATDKEGNTVSLYDTVCKLSQDIQDITTIAQWEYNSYDNLLDDVDTINSDPDIKNAEKKPNYIGRTLRIRLPDWFNEDKKSGTSRSHELYSDVIIRHTKSELERRKAYDGTSDKYVSAGWRRTASNHVSTIGRKISLSSVDRQYAYIDNNPFVDGYIKLSLVIQGNWYNLFFYFDNERFSSGVKVTLPDIALDDHDRVHFYFTVEYPYVYKEITSDYIVGVDVGVAHYATVSVINKDNHIVHTTTLTRRVHALENSISATSNQIIFLRKKRDKYHMWEQEYSDISQEIQEQRQKNVRKKMQLAIIAAQEIAYISYVWDNAPVCCEDLSWVHNTMQNGRWNRGKLVSRLQEYVQLNGSRVLKVNCANTSKQCYRCKGTLHFIDYHTVKCHDCDMIIDRDINAAANVAYNGIQAVKQMCATRKRSMRYKKDKNSTVLRTPVTTDTLCYKSKHKSRRKQHATGKCNNKKLRKQYKLRRYQFHKEVSKSNGAVTHNDDVTVLMDGNLEIHDYQDSQKATKIYINKTCVLYDLLI